MIKAFERCANFLLLILVVLAFLASVPCSFAQANVQGQWNTLPTQMPINPVHVALMHNGKVLIVSGSGNLPSDTNYMAAVWDPATDSVTTQPVGWDMFCNGMIVLPDGRPFVMGGTIQYDPFYGQPKTSAYDPATGKFADLEPMAHGRWYPTATTLADGSVMIFSGLLETGGTNTAVEIYKLGSGWSQQYVASWTPPLYPRMHLLPNGNVFYSGSTTSSAIFNTSTHTWTTGVAHTIYSGTRTYGTSVLLPLTPANGYKPRVMIMGGGNPSTNTTEIIDLSVSNPKWVSGPSMSQPRIEMNATILPNGKILASGGSLNDEDGTTASLDGDLYDPVANTFSSAGANVYARLYHSNSLLLPDATVLLLGSNPARGTYEPHMEIYSPPYLFNADGTPATRPTISGTSSSVIGYGGAFQVQTPAAASISSVVLMHNGAATHAFDMDQRNVGLSFTSAAGVLNVTGPPNGNIAPPGDYMLFILNSAGVPSIATMVQVSSAANDVPPTGTITSPGSSLTISAGQFVSYSGTGSDPDGTISAYSWSFPGGSPSSSSLANPGSVTYSTPGTYVTTFTVTDNAGLTDPNPPTRTITVQAPPSITSANNTTFTVGAAGSFTVTTTGAPTPSLSESGTLPSGVTFVDNGNGTAKLSGTPGVGTAGTYSLTFTASNGVGTPASQAFTLTVGSSSGTPVGFMQAVATAAGSASTLSLSFLKSTVAGDLIFVAFDYDTSSTPSSVTDSQNNVFTPVGNQLTSPGGTRSRVYYAKNIKGGADTVTVNLTANSGWIELYLTEYSGVDQTNPIDAQAGASGNAGAVSSGFATTTVAGDVIYGYCVGDSTCTVGSAFAARSTFNNNLIEDMTAGNPGSYAATGTANNGWTMQMVALKKAQ
jgi:Domain of unknown function (DUF1929)/PKD domain